MLQSINRPTRPIKTFNWEKPCAYDDQQKQAFHREATKRLKALAAFIGWDKSSFDLRKNKAGIACSGEITLHHDHVYIQVSQSTMGSSAGILLRTCNGRRDYTGGSNNFAPLNLLDDIPALATRVASLI